MMFWLIALLATLFEGNLLTSELKKPTESINISRLALANNEFAFKLHQTFNTNENVFISPASIFTVLGMLYVGARGTTAKEIHKTASYEAAGLSDKNINRNFQELLKSLESSDERWKLKMANAIISHDKYPVLEEYKETLVYYYGAVVKEYDFDADNERAVEEINKWINDRTEGKIPKLLKSLDRETLLVLLNAVYFKASWKNQFNPEYTDKGEFYNNGINPVSVPMMFQENMFRYGRFSDYNVEVLRMPYMVDTVSMVIVLPFERNGLPQVERELTAAVLDSMINNLNYIDIFVQLPKFKLEDSRELKDNLRSLGMGTSFSNRANFGGINRNADLKVSKFMHKAVVDINEGGTEAAGATAVITSTRSFSPTFLVKYPFLFFIIDDKTGLILFFGRVNEL